MSNNNGFTSSSFKYKGKKYKLIAPKSFDEVLKAINTKRVIEQLIAQMEPGDHQDAGIRLLNEQIRLMQDYVNSMGAFDNTLFIDNLDYLLRNKGLKTGELEELLTLSAGYISRTANKKSKKRISIDVIWKISKLFNIDLKTLLETDLSIKTNNNIILIKFLQKIRRQIMSHELIVEMHGGYTYNLNDKIREAGIVYEMLGDFLYVSEKVAVNKDLFLADDILGIPNFKDDKSLLVIPFKEKSKKNIYYEFLLFGKECEVESIFCTIEVPFEDLQLDAKLLYEEMREQEFEAIINPDIKAMISQYLSDE